MNNTSDLILLNILSKLLQQQKELGSEIALSQDNYGNELLSKIDRKLRNTSLDEFNFPTRLHNILSKADLKTGKDILTFGFDNLLKRKNFGVGCLNELKEVLQFYLNVAQIDKKNLCELMPKEKQVVDEPDHRDKNILLTSLDELVFSVRVWNVLARAKLTTIEDVLNYGWLNFLRHKNFGKQTLKELRKTIKDFVEEAQIKKRVQTRFDVYENVHKEEDKSLPLDIGIFFTKFLTDQQSQVIKARYGYGDGKRQTLDKVGAELGVTKQRIQQIEAKSLRRLKHPSRKKYIQEILEHIEFVLLNNKGIISINDLYKDDYFSFSNRNQLKFLFNLLTNLYKERYRIIDKIFLTSLDKHELTNLQSFIREALFKCKFPSTINDFIQQIVSYSGSISIDYLSHFLFKKKHVVVSNSKVLSPAKLSIPQQVKFVLRDISKPLHFMEIVKLYKNYFGTALTKASDLEHAIHDLPPV